MSTPLKVSQPGPSQRLAGVEFKSQEAGSGRLARARPSSRSFRLLILVLGTYCQVKSNWLGLMCIEGYISVFTALQFSKAPLCHCMCSHMVYSKCHSLVH